VTTVGIVGAGTMGTGIAQVALEAGDEVLLYDVDPVAIERAVARVDDGLARRARKAGLHGDAVDDWVEAQLQRLRTSPTLEAIAAEADLVIEAALEDHDLKQAIFRALDSSAPVATILATNTSALSVASIAESTIHPQRVLGLHFFNPVPLMDLVEVVVTEETNPTVAHRADAVMASWGKTVVRCADAPGFIVNRVNRPFTIEALRLLEAGEGTADGIDAAMRDAGYPMGPFELMDLVGIDVNLAAARSVWEALGRPDHLRPSPIQERLVATGRLGRKTGQGFYRYVDGARADDDGAVPEPVATALVTPSAIVARIEAAVTAEARALARDGLATEDDIALALRLGAGHPRSPFAT
jgi:3-hydroxybutyryl-CoA dehydrogenase